MSPVWAPLLAQWQSWAPRSTGLPAMARATDVSKVAGGQIRTSFRSVAVLASVRTQAATSAACLTPSAIRPFIFQLPAISGRTPDIDPLLGKRPRLLTQRPAASQPLDLGTPLPPSPPAPMMPRA